MDFGKLPPRLALIASIVPLGARVADVGTDHGLLPAWLLEKGIAVSAFATDIRPGPLSRAETIRLERGLDSMRCVLCDGLQVLGPGDADTVIIAGMGGENITGILQRAPWTSCGTLLVLQPMSRPEVLRSALTDMGIAIQDERLVKDSGKIYSIIIAGGGKPSRLSLTETFTGQYELVSKEELFLPMLDGLEKKLTAAVKGLQNGEERTDREQRIKQLLEIIEGIREMRRRKNAESR